MHGWLSCGDDEEFVNQNECTKSVLPIGRKQKDGVIETKTVPIFTKRTTNHFFLILLRKHSFSMGDYFCYSMEMLPPQIVRIPPLRIPPVCDASEIAFEISKL